MTVQYRMVLIGGKARMSRPSNVVYPLPAVRLNTSKLVRSPFVRDMERTAVSPASWKPGSVLARSVTLTFP